MTNEELIKDMSELMSDSKFIKDYINKCEDRQLLNEIVKMVESRFHWFKWLDEIEEKKEEAKTIRNQFYNDEFEDANNALTRKNNKVKPELANFLGISVDRRISRHELRKMIMAYIYENELRCFEERKSIILDNTLKELLNIETDKISHIQIIREFFKLFDKT